MLFAAQEQAICDGDGGGDDVFAHFVFREKLEFTVDADDEDDAVFAGGVELAVGHGGRGVVAGGVLGELAGPEGFSVRGIYAHDLAAIAEDVDAAFVFNGGGYE